MTREKFTVRMIRATSLLSLIAFACAVSVRAQDEAQASETYIVSVASRRFVFQPQVIFVNEDIDDLVLTAIEQAGSDVLQS